MKRADRGTTKAHRVLTDGRDLRRDHEPQVGIIETDDRQIARHVDAHSSRLVQQTDHGHRVSEIKRGGLIGSRHHSAKQWNADVTIRRDPKHNLLVVLDVGAAQWPVRYTQDYLPSEHGGMNPALRKFLIQFGSNRHASV